MVLRDGLRPERLAQGDILDEVEFYAPRNGSYRDTNRFPGMITSHSCDFTKFVAERGKGAPIDRFPLLVAPLIKEAQIDRGTAGHARAGRVARYFYLGEEYAGEGHILDFWFMQPVAALELLELTREASLTDEWQTRLQRGLDRFFSREDRKKVVDSK